MKKSIEFLKQLNEDGRRPRLWLRDDDICTDTPNFRLLVQLSKLGFPMVFAAVPYRLKFADSELKYIEGLPENVYFCVHGFNHINRAKEGRTSEYPASTPSKQVSRELTYGQEKVNSYFPERFIPMFVPPWNYIAPEHISALEEAGFKYVSGDKGMPLTGLESTLIEIPSHVDVLNYGDDMWFPLKSEEQIDNELLNVLKGWEALGNDSASIGILSHHTSMLSKDIMKFKTIIHSISEYFEPLKLI